MLRPGEEKDAKYQGMVEQCHQSIDYAKKKKKKVGKTEETEKESPVWIGFSNISHPLIIGAVVDIYWTIGTSLVAQR